MMVLILVSHAESSVPLVLMETGSAHLASPAQLSILAQTYAHVQLVSTAPQAKPAQLVQLTVYLALIILAFALNV